MNNAALVSGNPADAYRNLANSKHVEHIELTWRTVWELNAGERFKFERDCVFRFPRPLYNTIWLRL
jgi:hypothetical protein